MKELLRAVPRLARMIAGLLMDAEVPRGVRIALVAVALYLASPVDLVPDFIPLVGYVDDVLLAAVVVDGVLTFVDRPLLLRYWPGTEASLETAATVARRLARWVPDRLKAQVFGGRRAA